MRSSRGAVLPAVVYLTIGGGSVAIAALVLGTGRPTSWLLVAAPAAVLAVAVVHAVVAIASRRAVDTREGARPRRSFAGVFGVAPRGMLGVAGLVFASAWLVGVLAMAVASAGVSYDDGPPSCRYYLNDHGVQTCVSWDRYVAGQAAEQALLFAVLGGILAGCGALTMGSTPAPAARGQQSRVAPA
jgi:hypothetical protein